MTEIRNERNVLDTNNREIVKYAIVDIDSPTMDEGPQTERGIVIAIFEGAAAWEDMVEVYTGGNHPVQRASYEVGVVAYPPNYKLLAEPSAGQLYPPHERRQVPPPTVTRDNFMDAGTTVTPDLQNSGLIGTVNKVISDHVVRVEWPTCSHTDFDFVETLEFKHNLQVVDANR